MASSFESSTCGRFSPFRFERHHGVSSFVLGDDGMIWLWIARADVTCPGLLSLYLFRLWPRNIPGRVRSSPPVKPPRVGHPVSG